MKFKNIRVYNFENALRGMRNPKDSWHLSDSYYGFEYNDAENIFQRTHGQNYEILHVDGEIAEFASIGPKDMKLAQTLIKGGPEHRKFLRQIQVSVDITAPLYWWKEFDTYKVGTVANSTSTMHTLTNKPITLDCFEISDFHNIEYPLSSQREDLKSDIDEDFVQMALIPYLEYLRTTYVKLQKELKELHDDKEKAEKLTKMMKIIWKELIRWLPNGWLQTRTVTMNYENLLAMCSVSQRRFHKLTEWSGDGPDFVYESFIKMARSLPYAQEFIFIDELQN